jgi:hypothetical protein
MFFKRNLLAWCLGSLGVIGLGFLFLPPMLARPAAFRLLRFPAFTVAEAAVAVAISLASHGAAGAWSRIFGPRRFQGLSTGKTFTRRVLDDGIQVFLFLLAQGAFGMILCGIALGMVLLLR